MQEYGGRSGMEAWQGVLVGLLLLLVALGVAYWLGLTAHCTSQPLVQIGGAPTELPSLPNITQPENSTTGK